MSRRAARDTALRLFYEYAITNEFNPATMDVMRDCFDKGMNENAWTYVGRLIDIYKTHADEVDAVVQKNSKKWNISHMAKVELSILRLGICEIVYCDDIHVSITINECVDLAKKFSTEKSARFVNGVLAAIVSGKEVDVIPGDEETETIASDEETETAMIEEETDVFSDDEETEPTLSDEGTERTVCDEETEPIADGKETDGEHK